ncbi:MAG: NUDIX domain-containing protein [Lentimicrobium sp.]|nr:NUDIX domain-containing protein [Lentimicrobium sp.]
MQMTRFPKGGLIAGEGTIDCLKREWMEEFGQGICNITHLYTTDFFQPSTYLNEVQQIINIYYQASLYSEPVFAATEKLFDFELEDGAQTFRWLKYENLDFICFTLPIDRTLVKKIIENEISLSDSE